MLGENGWSRHDCKFGQRILFSLTILAAACGPESTTDEFCPSRPDKTERLAANLFHRSAFNPGNRGSSF